MKDYNNTPILNDADVEKRAQSILKKTMKPADRGNIYRQILGMIDLTTLEGADTREKVEQMCFQAKAFADEKYGIPPVAAVCVYPTLVSAARKALEGSGIGVASVAGAFPAGQSPIHIKTAEVRYAVEQGAEEIDMVISRGRFLEGEYNLVFDEIAAILEACGPAHLKVILETGELKTATNIRRASEIALDTGAHFIKTSTGKISPAATPQAMLVMLEAIAEHYKNTGHRAGIKPAGGISDPETALGYYGLTREILGQDWLNKGLFRFGASRLAGGLEEAIRSEGSA